MLMYLQVKWLANIKDSCMEQMEVCAPWTIMVVKGCVLATLILLAVLAQ